MTECMIKKGTPEYDKLCLVADMLTMYSKNRYEYRVEDTYLDFGQDWKWTTICRDSEWGGVQVLTPRSWKEIILAESIDELVSAYKSIIEGKYFGDK